MSLAEEGFIKYLSDRLKDAEDDDYRAGFVKGAHWAKEIYLIGFLHTRDDNLRIENEFTKYYDESQAEIERLTELTKGL